MTDVSTDSTSTGSFGSWGDVQGILARYLMFDDD